MKIRKLEDRDWQDLKRIRLEALRSHPGLYMRSYESAQASTPADWRAQFRSPQAQAIFGLYDMDQIAGLAAVFSWAGDPSGRIGILAMDYVSPAYRGQGFSRLLYRARLDWALAQPQFDKLRISHREGNEPSRRANQAFGFLYTGREWVEWPDGTWDWEYNYERDLVAMRKENLS